MRYKLQVLNRSTGAIDGEWILHLPAVVGRSPDVDVPIGDPSISRRHCEFLLNGEGALTVHDFDSMNGTYIDDRRITREVLKPGDVVRIGAVNLKAEWTDEPVAENTKFGSTNVNTTQRMRTISKNDMRKSS